MLRGTRVTSCKRLLGLLKLGSGSGRVSHGLLSEVVSVLSAEVASVMFSTVARDDCTETGLSGLDGAIDEG